MDNVRLLPPASNPELQGAKAHPVWPQKVSSPHLISPNAFTASELPLEAPAQPLQWSSTPSPLPAEQPFVEGLMATLQPHSASEKAQLRYAGQAFHEAWSSLHQAAQAPELRRATQGWLDHRQKQFEVVDPEGFAKACWFQWGVPASSPQPTMPEAQFLPELLNRKALRQAALGSEGYPEPSNALSASSQGSESSALFHTLCAQAAPSSPLPTPDFLGDAACWPLLLRESADWNGGPALVSPPLKGLAPPPSPLEGLKGSTPSGSKPMGLAASLLPRWLQGASSWTHLLFQERNHLAQWAGAAWGGLKTMNAAPQRGAHWLERWRYGFSTLGEGIQNHAGGLIQALVGNYRMGLGGAQLGGSLWSFLRWK